MELTPLVAVHMTTALAAVATGPVALWARKGRAQHPWLHRAFGYAWVTLMVVAAASALFIRDFELPNIAGYTAIHLLIPVTFAMLFTAFWFLAQKTSAATARPCKGSTSGPASWPVVSPCCRDATWAIWSGASGWALFESTFLSPGDAHHA